MLLSRGLQPHSANLSPQAFRYLLSLALLIHHSAEREKVIVWFMGMSRGMAACAPHPLMSTVIEVQKLQGPQAVQGGASLDMALPGHLTGNSVWHYCQAVKLRQ